MYGYMRVLPALWWGNKIMFVNVYLTYLFILGYGRYDEFLRAPIHLVLPAAFGPRIAPTQLATARGGMWRRWGKTRVRFVVFQSYQEL
jgi:hypothetical protein